MNAWGIVLALTVFVTASCSGAKSAITTPGFYRYEDEDGVYYIPSAMTTICAVQNPSMMWAYGGFGQVHVVNHSVDFRGKKQFTQACAWPAGYYRNVGSAVVYRATNGTVCRLPRSAHRGSGGTPNTLEAGKFTIRVISSDADVTANSKFTGICSH